MWSKIVNSSKNIVERSKEMVEIVKLRGTIDKIEAEITKRKIELGALTCRIYGEGKINDPDITELCKRIKGFNEEIARIEAQIEDLQKREILCPFCGFTNTADTSYCGRCGQSISSCTGANICPCCSLSNAVEDLFCSKCGTKLPGAIPSEADGNYCAKCSCLNDSKSKFCKTCGNNLL